MSYLLRLLLRHWPTWLPIVFGVMCVASATVLHRPMVILNRYLADRIFVAKPRHKRSAPMTWFSEVLPELPATAPSHFWQRAAVVICAVAMILWRVLTMSR